MICLVFCVHAPHMFHVRRTSARSHFGRDHDEARVPFVFFCVFLFFLFFFVFFFVFFFLHVMQR